MLIFSTLGTRSPFLTFFPAVMFVALRGGTGPGLFAILLSTVAAGLWYDPASIYIFSQPSDVVSITLFVITCLLIVWLCRAVGRMYSLTEAMQFEQAKLAAIVTSSDDAIVSKTLDGTITSWNDSAQRVFGYTADEMIGQNIRKIIPIERINEEDVISSKLRKGESVNHFETIRVRKDGTLIDISVSISPLYDTLGKVIGAAKIARDISQKKQVEIQLQAAQASAEYALHRLRAVVDYMTEGLILADPSGRLIEWNPAALKLHGFTRLDEVTHPLQDFTKTFEIHTLAGEKLPIERWPMTRILDGESFAHEEMKVHRLDINKSWIISYSGTPVRDAGGKIILAVLTLHDVTAHHQAIAERERYLSSERAAREEAQRVTRLKDEFLATVSHELRTPLNAILGYAHLLKNSSNDPVEVAEGAAVIERNARAQTQIIEDILDMSRIVSGKLRMEISHVNLQNVIGAAMETVRPAADAKHIQLQTKLDPAIVWVQGDPSRLQQCVWNLLTNAIKFTPRDGKVSVDLSHANSQAVMVVRDTGQGISSDFLPYVFDKFRQADSSTARKQGGLGLGLSIVKNLVEAHGGRVTAQSEGVNRGSTFTVEIPVANGQPHPSTEAPTEAKSNSVAPPRLNGVTVLSVDDENHSREFVERYLQECGADVISVETAEQAIDLLHKQPVDVIISDLAMPTTDGFELIRRIRAGETTHGTHCPAAALTALARSEDRVKSLHAGFQTHIAKPVEPLELAITVASLAGRSVN